MGPEGKWRGSGKPTLQQLLEPCLYVADGRHCSGLFAGDGGNFRLAYALFTGEAGGSVAGKTWLASRADAGTGFYVR